MTSFLRGHPDFWSLFYLIRSAHRAVIYTINFGLHCSTWNNRKITLNRSPICCRFIAYFDEYNGALFPWRTFPLHPMPYAY